MKVEIKNKKEEAKDIKFPVLMEGINSKRVVLFNGEREGVVLLKGTDSKYIGYYSDNWLECTNTDYWKPFNGIIELSNE